MQTAHSRRMVKKYGIPMLMTNDERVKDYLQTILAQVQGQLTYYHLDEDLLLMPSQNGSWRRPLPDSSSLSNQ